MKKDIPNNFRRQFRKHLQSDGRQLINIHNICLVNKKNTECNKKRAKDNNRHLIEKQKQMVTRQMNRCSVVEIKDYNTTSHSISA